MKYMGSKARHAKQLLPIILRDRKEGQWYVEPFVGGANMIDKVDGNRIGADLNPYLINALTAIRDKTESIPSNNKTFTESDYRHYREIKPITDWLTGYAGFALSFGGKWFGGWCRGKDSKGNDRDYVNEQYRAALKQSSFLRGVILKCCGYQDLGIPPKSIIYCDPPYTHTTGYKDKFNHGDFWQWCRDKCKQGHKVFVSEYTAPNDFVCLWEKKVNSSLTKNTGAKKATEKLFVHESQVDTCNNAGVI